jgi:hypothetical protein
MTEKDIVVFMDDDGNVVPKDQATRVQIVTTDDQGKRHEVYGVIEKKKP